MTAITALLVAGGSGGTEAGKPADKTADRTRRVIVNDDGSGMFSFFRPPVTTSDLNLMADKVAGTAVTTLCVALHEGHIVWHDSKVATHIADVKGPHLIPSLYRHVSVCQSLRQQKIDPLRHFVKRAHEKGLEFFASLRMNDVHGFARLSQFWKTHQDARIGDLRYDYAKPAVRKFRLAQIEEVCRNYAIDGFELDFLRTPQFFNAPRQDARFMTELVGDVRRMMSDVGRAKGKRLRLLVTVPRTIADCELVGLDVRTWIKRGLIDLLVAKSFIAFEQELPVAEWAELVKGSAVKFYAGFEHGDTIETFRAGAARYFRDGADGLYFYNFWSFGLPYNPLGRQILTEVPNPKLLADQDKHYALMGGGPCGGYHAYPRRPPMQVPALIGAGNAKNFTLDIADDLPAALQRQSLKDVTLRVISDAQAGLELALNDQAIPAALVKGKGGVWEAVVDSRIKSGSNTLRVTVTGARPVTISSVETLVRYQGSRPPAAQPFARTGGVAVERDTRFAAEEGPWKRLDSRCSSLPIELARQQWVKAAVHVDAANSLAKVKAVRLELRTPQTNAPGYKWASLYAAQPWETDRYDIRLNGRQVPKWNFIFRDNNPRDYWIWGIRLDVPAAWLKAGDNAVELRVLERDPQIGWSLPIFVHVDLFKQ